MTMAEDNTIDISLNINVSPVKLEDVHKVSELVLYIAFV
jgi:hypothetical protein